MSLKPVERVIVQYDTLSLGINDRKIHYQTDCGSFCFEVFQVWCQNHGLLAFFALSFDALDLDADDKDDLRQGFSSVGVPELPSGYDMFWEKSRYPAMEITYLAVSTESQHKGLGFSILDAIVEKARTQKLAGCQFLTVNALHISEYSAVGFYSAFGFSRYGNIAISSDIVPMFYTLYADESEIDL